MQQLIASQSLRPKQAAQFLGISESTFWRWCKQPGFPQLRKIGLNVVVIDSSELLAWRDRKITERA